MTLPYQLIHQLKVSSWSGMMTLWGLWFDRKLRTRLIRLFSHTEKRRSHPLCLTDTCLMIPLPGVPEGPWDWSHPHRKPRSKWRQGRDEGRRSVDECNMNISKRLECLLPWQTDCLGWVDFIPAICLKAVLGLLILRLIFPFLHVQHFVIIEKLGQTSTLTFQSHNFNGGRTFGHLHCTLGCWKEESKF